MVSIPAFFLLSTLVVSPENRCSEYHRGDYAYPQSVEQHIINRMDGRIYGPYTGRHFKHRSQVDIDHIVALSEAHDSGLCAADADTKAMFARDVFNLTLAAPEVNRCEPLGKCSKDAGEWLPEVNQCWFAYRVVKVRSNYGLTIDHTEASALSAIMENCASFKMVFYDDMVTPTEPDR